MPSQPFAIREPDFVDSPENLRRVGPAGLASVVFHVVLVGLFALLAPKGEARGTVERVDDGVVTTEPLDDGPKAHFSTIDTNPDGRNGDVDINYPVPRIAEISVPGPVRPDEMVGFANGDPKSAPTNLPPPPGFGANGQGGAMLGELGNVATTMGTEGGNGRLGPRIAEAFAGRSGSTREQSLRAGGGTTESEAAVTRGLIWLARHQSPDGRWKLDGNFPDKGNANDAAGTALGLLPFLGAGKTHKASKDNLYDKPIEKALKYLVNIQDKRTGQFSRDMYAHGLCTIAMCEAFGLSQDYNLKKPAQLAVNFIVSAQHSGGGWRYSPGQAGDISVSGWQIMALKSGLMAGLDVPAASLKKAQAFLDACVDGASEGYGYTGPQPTATMTAVSLLCRQYLQGWGPQNLRMIKAVDNYLKPNAPSPNKKDVYFHYYATQVMHHFGGQTWKDWNQRIRESLVASQAKDEKDASTFGSWSPVGDTWGRTGGRLMQTSLNLLTLEVYYRYLPLFYRDGVAKN